MRVLFFLTLSNSIDRVHKDAETSCSISLNVLYSRVFKLSGTYARGKCVISPAGLAHCRKRTASELVVCSDINKPGRIIVPDRVQPRKIFSHII